MSYQHWMPFDKTNEAHVKAFEYYKVTGHPGVIIGTGKPGELSDEAEHGDADIVLREAVGKVLKKPKRWLDDAYCNGSSHVVSGQPDENGKVRVAFAFEHDDMDVVCVVVDGTLSYNDREVVLCFNLGDIKPLKEADFDSLNNIQGAV